MLPAARPRSSLLAGPTGGRLFADWQDRENQPRYLSDKIEIRTADGLSRDGDAQVPPAPSRSTASGSTPKRRGSSASQLTRYLRPAGGRHPARTCDPLPSSAATTAACGRRPLRPRPRRGVLGRRHGDADSADGRDAAARVTAGGRSSSTLHLLARRRRRYSGAWSDSSSFVVTVLDVVGGDILLTGPCKPRTGTATNASADACGDTTPYSRSACEPLRLLAAAAAGRGRLSGIGGRAATAGRATRSSLRGGRQSAAGVRLLQWLGGPLAQRPPPRRRGATSGPIGAAVPKVTEASAHAAPSCSPARSPRARRRGQPRSAPTTPTRRGRCATRSRSVRRRHQPRRRARGAPRVAGLADVISPSLNPRRELRR